MTHGDQRNIPLLTTSASWASKSVTAWKQNTTRIKRSCTIFWQLFFPELDSQQEGLPFRSKMIRLQTPTDRYQFHATQAPFSQLFILKRANGHVLGTLNRQKRMMSQKGLQSCDVQMCQVAWDSATSNLEFYKWDRDCWWPWDLFARKFPVQIAEWISGHFLFRHLCLTVSH